ncbi:hypothetical protein PAHA111176_16950 [Parendozoicomonas haliclonae]|uniref:Uncharacterized protein n=1 Tax=Parendozoicomonas haliclonae TaxID=1960125 RepID=A0A1X7ANR0_9GAMM|nr:hypothetical protein EHSB41UT_03520 [Parendozoicomonas haliclonae]
MAVHLFASAGFRDKIFLKTDALLLSLVKMWGYPRLTGFDARSGTRDAV